MPEQNVRKIDRVDRGIISALRDDPQATNKHIAQELNISEATVATRIERLIRDRLITVTIQRDIGILGYEIIGLVEVFVEHRPVLELAEALGALPDVLSVAVFVDPPQLLILVIAENLQKLLDFTTDKVGPLDGVSRVCTAVSLETRLVRPGIAAL